MNIQAAFAPIVAMRAAKTATTVKPRYVLVNGKPVLKQSRPVVVPITPPVPTTEVEYTESWPTCGAPVVGEDCPKCKGNMVIEFHRSNIIRGCHWCSDDGKITKRDKEMFDKRIIRKMKLCFIMTTAPARVR